MGAEVAHCLQLLPRFWTGARLVACRPSLPSFYTRARLVACPVAPPALRVSQLALYTPYWQMPLGILWRQLQILPQLI